MFVLNSSHNNFVAILDLPEGEHQYKFFVDGQWTHDPSEVMFSFGSLFVFIEVSEDEKPAGFSANRWPSQRAVISGLTTETACSNW